MPLEPVIQRRRYVPPAVGARADQISIHRPVVILAERNSVARIVVMRLGEWDQVRCVDNVEAAFQNDSQTACRATVIVRPPHHATERSVAYRFENIDAFGDPAAFIKLPLIFSDLGFTFCKRDDLRALVREVAVDENEAQS